MSNFLFVGDGPKILRLYIIISIYIIDEYYVKLDTIAHYYMLMV